MALFEALHTGVMKIYWSCWSRGEKKGRGFVACDCNAGFPSCTLLFFLARRDRRRYANDRYWETWLQISKTVSQPVRLKDFRWGFSLMSSKKRVNVLILNHLDNYSSCCRTRVPNIPTIHQGQKRSNRPQRWSWAVLGCEDPPFWCKLSN